MSKCLLRKVIETLSFHTAVWNCYYQLYVVAKVAGGFVSYPVELVGGVFPRGRRETAAALEILLRFVQEAARRCDENMSVRSVPVLCLPPS